MSVPVEQFRSMFAFSAWSQKHLPHVDMSAPILVGTVRPNGIEVRFLLDGHHRVRRALDRQFTTLPGIVLDVAETSGLEVLD